MIDLEKALIFSKKLALKVGDFLLSGQKKVQIELYKDKQDILTNIDLDAEKLIIDQIEKKYPDHSIFSEEKGLINKKSDYIWYVDPLDGTKEYLRQIPNYCTTFCLFFKNKPILGIVNLPYSKQLFSAALNIGAFLNKEKIKVNNQNSLQNSFIYLVLPISERIKKDFFEKSFEKMKNLTKKAYRLREARQNNSLAFLALGSIEAYLNFTHPTKGIEDFVPGAFIAQMAGAKITDLKGKKLDFNKPKQLYIISNGQIHNQLIKVLNK